MARKRLGEILIEASIITQVQLDRCLREQERWGGRLGKILVDEGVVNENVLARALAKQLKLPIVSLEGVVLDEELKGILNLELIERFEVFPFAKEGKYLDVATNDPMNLGVLEELQVWTRLNIRPHIATASDIAKAIKSNYTVVEMTKSGLDRLYGDYPGVKSSPEPRLELTDYQAPPPAERDAEITALQRRVAALEARMVRDENVIRKVLALLIQGKVATREQILEILK